MPLSPPPSPYRRPALPGPAMEKLCLFCLSDQYVWRSGDPDCSGRLDTCPRHRATGGCAGCGGFSKKCFQAETCQRAKGDPARACSHCGATGHRKGLHCPKLKEEFLRDDEVAGQDPAVQERLWQEENARACVYCGDKSDRIAAEMED